jgi:2-polyprenyl-3-methyl-5-hydroxy-6-metoxy-1,4-benzoquinol methylase
MSDAASCRLRLLVVIANYGTANDKYLSRLIDEYRSMPYSTDIIVLSNVPKDLGPDIRVVVGLPSDDPRSLPFGHKQVFVDRINDYDLFMYSEDDILITHKSVEAFLRVAAVLPDNEAAGFLRFENGKDGNVFYPDVHGTHHWEARSVRSRADYRFAFFSNEHAGCYLLTRQQLQRAIQSGGFLVGPHQGKHGVLETAATDPYTQCGFTKLICISHLNDFLVHHLSNKYLGGMGLDAAQFERQICALLRIAAEGDTPSPLLDTHPEFKASRFGKDYYEPIRTDFASLIPASARSVLSIGCGWGATEERLAQDGKRVVAIPLDPVISACAQARRVELVQGDLKMALARLSGECFDCLLISNVLQLVKDPSEFLASFTSLLSDNAIVIAAVPNLLRIRVQWRKLCGVESHRFLGNYARSGVHFTSRGTVRKWLRRAGLRVDRFADVLPERAQAVCRGTLGLMTPLLSSEIVAVAAKNASRHHFPYYRRKTLKGACQRA